VWNLQFQKYFLALIQDVNNEATINIIQNPSKMLGASKNIYTTVQISWSVSQKEINNVLE
jgi:hypothetical protein